jgi:transcription elongation regulator 1
VSGAKRSRGATESKKIDAGKEAAMEAELKAAKERAIVPQEIRTKQFMEMLREKEVSVFSTWEKELHKIVFDQRYLLLPSKERKQVYEQYVRERADEERKEKSRKLRLKKDEFKQLLIDAKLHGRSSFSEFATKYGRDERFKSVDKMREKESLFNEYLIEVRRREATDTRGQSDKLKVEFMQMLHETGDINRLSSWSVVRQHVECDSRCRAVASNSLKEEWFMEYINSLGSASTDEGSEKRLRDKQERILASLREREKEVHQSLSASLRDRDREREQHLKEEAVQHFNALMADMVRNADLSWHETRKMLHSDHRWRLTKLLDKAERQRLFEEHIASLSRRNRDVFHRLIDENVGSVMLMKSTWRDVRKLIKDDPRFVKFSSSDRKREKEFEEYRQERVVQAKIDYRELLKETKIITYKSARLMRDSDQHIKDIMTILQNDQRHLVLDCIADERRQILLSYIEDLERKGQPPPPTASEPSRKTAK